MCVALATKFLFGKFMLELANLIEYTLIFTIFDGGKDRVIHNFNKYAILPEDLTFLKREDDNSRVLNRLDNRNEKILDII